MVTHLNCPFGPFVWKPFHWSCAKISEEVRVDIYQIEIIEPGGKKVARRHGGAGTYFNPVS